MAPSVPTCPASSDCISAFQGSQGMMGEGVNNRALFGPLFSHHTLNIATLNAGGRNPLSQAWGRLGGVIGGIVVFI